MLTWGNFYSVQLQAIGRAAPIPSNRLLPSIIACRLRLDEHHNFETFRICLTPIVLCGGVIYRYSKNKRILNLNNLDLDQVSLLLDQAHSVVNFHYSNTRFEAWNLHLSINSINPSVTVGTRERERIKWNEFYCVKIAVVHGENYEFFMSILKIRKNVILRSVGINDHSFSFFWGNIIPSTWEKKFTPMKWT